MAYDLELFVSVLERNIDNRGKTPPLSSTGYPLIEVKHIQENHIYPVFEDTKFVDQHTWNTWFRAHLEPGDLLFSTVGSIARSCIVPEKPKFCIAQNVLGFRVNRSKADSRFLYYAINDSFFQNEVKGRTVETVQKSIKVHDLKTCRITVPPLAIQKAIAAVLGTLDDKIELNRGINGTLEATAQALFRSWFVDFDPVRVLSGQMPQAPPFLSAKALKKAGFPDRFQDSELGEIPENWRLGTLGEVAKNPREVVEPHKLKPSTPYIGLEHMPRRSVALAEWGYADELESNKFEFKRGEILFGKLRPYFHKVGIAPLDGVCSTDIVVIKPKVQDWVGFVLGHVSSLNFVNYTNASSTGTKMPRTNWLDMSRYKVALPPQLLAAAFTEQVSPLMERMVTNIHESRTLAELRDALLPKLMSGELRLKEAEESVNAAS